MKVLLWFILLSLSVPILTKNDFCDKYICVEKFDDDESICAKFDPDTEIMQVADGCTGHCNFYSAIYDTSHKIPCEEVTFEGVLPGFAPFYNPDDADSCTTKKLDDNGFCMGYEEGTYCIGSTSYETCGTGLYCNSSYLCDHAGEVGDYCDSSTLCQSYLKCHSNNTCLHWGSIATGEETTDPRLCETDFGDQVSDSTYECAEPPYSVTMALSEDDSTYVCYYHYYNGSVIEKPSECTYDNTGGVRCTPPEGGSTYKNYLAQMRNYLNQKPDCPIDSKFDYKDPAFLCDKASLQISTFLEGLEAYYYLYMETYQNNDIACVQKFTIPHYWKYVDGASWHSIQIFSLIISSLVVILI